MSSYSNKNKVLVAGATGLIGSNLVNQLVEQGYDVRGTLHDNEPSIPNPRVEYVKADLTSLDDCYRVVKNCDYVFMCAANTSGAAVMKKSPLNHVTPNVVMNSQILHAAYESKVSKFLWISSSAAYPPTGDRPVTESEMFDGDPYESYYFVGWMKRFGEIMCRMYGEKIENPMTTIVIRPTNVYGPFDDFNPETSHVTAALIRKVIERQSPIVVWGDGNDIRDIIYVDDLVNIIITAIETLDHYTAMNIGYGQGFSVKQILAKLLRIDGYENPEIIYDSKKPSMIPVRLVDINHSVSSLKLGSLTAIDEGLERTMKWYRQFG